MTETSRIVAIIDKPIAVTGLSKIVKALETIYGDGLTLSQGRWVRFEIRTPGPLCWCSTCEDRDAATVVGLTGDWMRTISRFMIPCPDCGNKRCPRANDHNYDCTGSNETGQEGSAYAEDPLLQHVRAMAWDRGHSATDEHGPNNCECPNPYRATTPDPAPREVGRARREGAAS